MRVLLANKDNVKQLIILGNGFDLQCGIKTTYSSFIEYVLTNKYKSYLEQLSQNNLTAIESFEKYVQNLVNCYNDDLLIDSSLNVTWSFFPKINIWYIIFLYEKINQSANWSSVEDIIKRYVKTSDMPMAKFTEFLSDAVFIRAFHKVRKSAYYMEQKTLENFARLIVCHLFRRINDVKIIKLNSLIEQIESYEKIFNTNNSKDNLDKIEQNNLPKVQNLITEILLSELNDLEDDFQDFLQNQLADHLEYSQNVSNTLYEIAKTNNHELNYNIFNFNYTVPWKKDKRLFPKLKSYINVHGEMKADNSIMNNIIFGIDSIGLDPIKHEYRFTKAYRTLELYTDYNYLAESTEKIFTKDIVVIKFYGHSLTEADYSYFQHIFDLYDLYNSSVKLIFYYSEYAGREASDIKQEQLSSISCLIEKYGETLDNKNHGKNLLTRLIQTGRLKLICI